MEEQVDINRLQSKVIDFLRLPLMIGIVVIHCRFTMRLQPYIAELQIVGGGGYDLVSHLISRVLCGMCVPCFFLISGFLFFKGGHFCLRGYVDKLKKRFFTLLIPFILWNLLYLLPYLFKGWELIENEAGEILPIVPWFQDCEGSLFKTVYNWTYGLFINFNGASAPIDVPFWYLRDLMCMIVISPLVYYFVKYSKLIGLVLCCLVWVLLGQYRIIPYAFPIPLRPAVLFFLIGAYFSINRKNMIWEFSKIGNWIYFAYGLLAAVDLLTKDETVNFYIHRITILVGVVLVFKIGIYVVNKSKSSESKLYGQIKNTNFFIYGSHWIVLYLISYPLFRLIVPGNDFSLVAVYLLQIPICLAICISVGVLLNILTPRLMRVLNGR